MTFNYFKRYDVNENCTAIYTFEKLPNKPKLVCAPATTENPGFVNLSEQLNREKAAKPERPSQEQSEAEKAADELAGRLRSASIIARVCARSFVRAPVDDEGKELEFSTENVQAWLEGMATDCVWQFTRFCGWLLNSANFMPISQPEAEQLAKK